MDPITWSCGALILGLVTGSIVPGSTLSWSCIAIGTLLWAAVSASLARFAPAAFVVGMVLSRGVAPGPALEGPVALVGVRVGAPSGGVADLLVQRSAVPDAPAVTGRIRVRFPGVVPGPGVPMVIFGQAGPVRGQLPGAPDPIRAAGLAGIRTEVLATRAARLDGEAPSPLGADRDRTGLLRALALGDTSGCSRDTLDTLRNTGTSHLLSVSGFHVGAASALILGLSGLLLRALAILRPAGLSPMLPILLGVAGAWGYSVLAGSPVPAQRAAALLSLAALGALAGRRTAPVPLLALIAAALAVLDPSAPASASYQLTFGAMYGLVLFVPRMARHLPPDLPWGVGWSLNGLFATAGSTLGTLPFAAWWFQAVAPLSPVANLVALPVLGVAVVPLAVLACFAPWPIDSACAWVGTLACEVVLACLRPMAIEPLAPAVGPLGALLLGVAVLGGLRRPLLGGAFGIAVLTWPASVPAVDTVTFLDVGQGDAVLVERADGFRMLVDGGPNRGAVVSWLRRRHIRHLDVVVSTHPERDHTLGLLAVVQHLSVAEIWANDADPDLVAAAARARVPIRAPRGALNGRPDDEGAVNERSLVLAAARTLLAADAGRAAEPRIIERLEGTLPVLKVGHHGSRTSTGADLLAALRPKLAVISVGRDNRYGHPAAAVVQRLEQAGALVVRTDREGTVVVQSHPDRLVVKTRSGVWVLPDGPPEALR